MLNKRYLLLAGDNYYPQSGTEDWIGCYASEDEALNQIETIEHPRYFSKRPRKGQIDYVRKTYTLKNNGRRIDWFKVVDLLDWMN